MRVRARSKALLSAQFASGTVTELHDDGAASVRFATPESFKMCRWLIRASTEDDIVVGARVRGNWREQGNWYPGVVHAVNKDGTATIHYDDGDVEENVPNHRLRLEDEAAMSSLAAKSLGDGCSTDTDETTSSINSIDYGDGHGY